MSAQLDLIQMTFFSEVFNAMLLSSLLDSYARWGVQQLLVCIDFDVSLEVEKVKCLLLKKFFFKEFGGSSLWSLGLSPVASVTYFTLLSVLLVQSRLDMIFQNSRKTNTTLVDSTPVPSFLWKKVTYN